MTVTADNRRPSRAGVPGTSQPDPKLSLAGTAQELLRRFPPRPVPTSWPATHARRDQVAARLLAPPFALPNQRSQRGRRDGLVAAMSWLQDHPGDTWQQRWTASGAQTRLDVAGSVAAAAQSGSGQGPPYPSRLLGLGLLTLIGADVIRPDIAWLMSSPPAPQRLSAEVARVRDPDGFAELSRWCHEHPAVSDHAARVALRQIAVILAAKGGTTADITIGDCVQLLAVAATVQSGSDRHMFSPFFYQMLHAQGRFGPAAPPSLRVWQAHGQRSVEELIGRHGIVCQPVRDLLVDYLRERQLTIDYATLPNLAYTLGKMFWRDLELHHPDIDSLWLAPHVAAAWKQRVMTKTTRTVTPHGEVIEAQMPRLAGRTILSAVRTFYLDIAEWALDEPARWGPWVARCPIRAGEISHKKDLARRKSRMDQRTREQMPALATLVRWADQERKASIERLEAARATAPGDRFTAGGQTRQRSVTKTSTSTRVWVNDADNTGKRRDLVFEEHRAFWTWATVEVLRMSGIRIEELTELSHHSLIQYRLPATGELIPLLQIAPSKTDAERLLVVSPELADVLATIISRIRGHDGKVPLVAAYDTHERLYNPPMPLLFQWRSRLENRYITGTFLRDSLHHALAATGLTDSAGQPLRFRPHDFRRLFITDAIMHGMPPHIAQLVAGHGDINTTMGYKAVYPEEVINGHRAFIARRRATRPSEEYRTPTDAEWEEFLGHFERRKLSLGTCGRAFGSNCIHEHSCIRCSLLRPEPAQRHRLVEIRDNLVARIKEANEHGWYGDIEGLNVSLAAAQQKLAQIEEIITRRSSVHLGMPSFPDIASRTITAGEPETPIRDQGSAPTDSRLS